MKKGLYVIIVSVLLIFSAMAGFSQGYIKPNNGYGTIMNRLRSDSTLHVPTGNGAPSGTTGVNSLRSTYTSMSAIFFDSTNGFAYFYNPKTAAWAKAGLTPSDSSVFARKAGVNYFTSRNNFKGLTIDKDSIPITTTNINFLTVDTPTNRVQRRSLASIVGGSTGEIQYNGGGIFSATSNLFWDASNVRLGIGTNAPSERFHFVASTSGSRIQYIVSSGNSTNGQGGIIFRSPVSSALTNLGFITTIGDNNSQTNYRSNTLLVSKNATQFVSGSFFEFRPNNTYSETALDDTKRRARIYADGSIWSDAEVSSAPAASSVMELASTARGFLPPRMTSTQRDAISSPATGLTLYCTDCTANDASTGVMQTYNGATWKSYW